MEEKQLVRLAQGGSPAAFEELVAKYQPKVFSMALSFTRNREAADDLAQEIFLKLFSRLDQYQPRTEVPFEHWVSRLAVRTCLDALRAERRRPEIRWADFSSDELQWLEYLMAREEESKAPETPAASARDVLDRLMAGLSDADRLVIRMLDLEQKSVREISQLTGWSQTWVKVRAFRARHKLRRIAASMERDL